MGIESDQLVYDYLSRVGDLAQQRQLPAKERMRLVATLRDEIDRRRATHGEEGPAAVRGILGALGTPDEVVDRVGDSPPSGPAVPSPRKGPGRSSRTGPGAAAGPGPAPGPGTVPGAREGSVPGPRTGSRTGPGAGPGAARGPGERTGRGAGWLPGRRRPRDGGGTGATGGPDAGSSPGGRVDKAAAPPAAPPAGPGDRGGPTGPGPDWWRDVDAAEGLPGFVGGVERPDLFEEPLPGPDEHGEHDEGEERSGTGGGSEEGGTPGKGAARPARRSLARVLRRRGAGTSAAPAPRAAAPAPRFRLTNPFVLLAALLLLGGALLGSLLAVAAGWLLAYASRRLTPGEAKTAVLVIPGLAVASGALWLWGRTDGRWGAPLAAGGEAMGAAVSETWPVVLRGAAVASALFLLWRSRRR